VIAGDPLKFVLVAAAFGPMLVAAAPAAIMILVTYGMARILTHYQRTDSTQLMWSRLITVLLTAGGILASLVVLDLLIAWGL
jgi:hypothetical protein